jgi:hypothetical protein
LTTNKISNQKPKHYTSRSARVEVAFPGFWASVPVDGTFGATAFPNLEVHALPFATPKNSIEAISRKQRRQKIAKDYKPSLAKGKKG